MIRQRQVVEVDLLDVTGLASFLVEGARATIELTLTGTAEVFAACKGEVNCESGKVTSVKKDGREILPIVERIVGRPIVFHGKAVLPGAGPFAFERDGSKAVGAWNPQPGLTSSTFTMDVTITDPEINTWISAAKTAGGTTLTGAENIPDPQPEPEPEPEPPPANWQPHNGAVLYLPCTCGWFNSGIAEVRKVIAWAAKYRGRVGLNFEVTGSTGNADVVTSNWKTAFGDHIEAFVAVAVACAEAGVPCKFDAVNRNDLQKGWGASFKRDPDYNYIVQRQQWLAVQLAPHRKWMIVQPISEPDNTLPSGFVNNLRRAWTAAGWETSRICGLGIKETHTANLEPLHAGELAATDNNEAIRIHFGPAGTWVAYTPQQPACSKYGRHYVKDRNVHASLYNRAPALHVLEFQAVYEDVIRDCGITAGPGNPGTPPPAPSTDQLNVSGGTIQVCIRNKQQPSTAKITKQMKSAKIEGGNVRWSYSDITGWPQKPGDKVLNGKCHMYWAEGNAIYGGHFDWLAKGQTVKTLANVSNGYFTKRPPTGADVYFCLISLDGKERTNLIKCTNRWGMQASVFEASERSSEDIAAEDAEVAEFIATLSDAA